MQKLTGFLLKTLIFGVSALCETHILAFCRHILISWLKTNGNASAISHCSDSTKDHIRHFSSFYAVWPGFSIATGMFIT